MHTWNHFLRVLAKGRNVSFTVSWFIIQGSTFANVRLFRNIGRLINNKARKNHFEIARCIFFLRTFCSRIGFLNLFAAIIVLSDLALFLALQINTLHIILSNKRSKPRSHEDSFTTPIYISHHFSSFLWNQIAVSVLIETDFLFPP